MVIIFETLFAIFRLKFQSYSLIGKSYADDTKYVIAVKANQSDFHDVANRFDDFFYLEWTDA